MKDESLDALNLKYWVATNTEQQLAGLCVPEKEFFDVVAPSARVLDVGCGAGVVASLLTEKGYIVSGVDINPNAVRVCTEKVGTEGTCVVGNITKEIPFPDETFDAVVVAFVLVSVIDAELCARVVQEIERILAPGGTVWVAEAGYSPDYAHRYEEGKKLTNRDGIALAEDPKTGAIHRVIHHYTPKELDNLFSSFSCTHAEERRVTSPHSGSIVNTLVRMYKKPNKNITRSIFSFFTSLFSKKG